MTWLIKTDIKGNEQWNKILEGRQANFVQQTSDNVYILAGDTFSDKTKSLEHGL